MGAYVLATKPAGSFRCFDHLWPKGIREYADKNKRAKLLLASTSIPIGSISINVGVLDANYFARLFKRMTGVTPKEYREKNKK